MTHSHLTLNNLDAGPAIDANDKIAGKAHEGIQWTKISDNLMRTLIASMNDQYLSALWGAKANVFRDGFGYLKSFFALLDYFDGPSLYRATSVNPSNPWAEFDPEHFEAFRQTQEYYADQVCSLYSSYY